MVAGGCQSSSSTGSPNQATTTPSTTGALTVKFTPSASTGLSSFPSNVANIQSTVTSSSASANKTQTVAVSTGAATYSGLTAATDYAVSLKALDSAGSTVWTGSTSGVSVVAGQTTTVTISMACPTTQATAYSSRLTISNIAPTSLTVNWTAQSGSGYTYRVYRSTASSLCAVLQSGTPLNSFTSGISSFDDSNLTANTAYNYAVVAKDSSGNLTNYPPLSITTLTSGQSLTKEDTSSSLPSSYISSVTVAPDDFHTVYVTFSSFGVKHLWKSTDSGATWTSLDGSGSTGIPDIPVQCLFIDPLNTQHLFLGTDLGVLFSSDGGATWVNANTSGMANVDVEHFAYQASTRTLVAFTHGRGAYTLALP